MENKKQTFKSNALVVAHKANASLMASLLNQPKLRNKPEGLCRD